ncbi:DNA/RNA nuclease SfsA [Thermicanus aegyptius]|uniref:DNA/RNA nuclease SfsA n=1 Tax=Thermicanus aegyptius TaxID=94009 RepID=UPI00041C4A35|nr:DNA/RNA nuclease SfsA [Thermicanus aegyptius]
MVFLPFPPLREAVFLERPNRFLLRCRFVDEEKEVVKVHLPDPGRLKEIFLPGRRIWIAVADGVNRKTRFRAVLSERPDGKGFLSLDSTLPNQLVEAALKEKELEEWEGFTLVKREARAGDSRFDFLLHNREGVPLFLEIKSVTLVRGGIGFFPDAVTARGAKHVTELAQLAGKGDQAALLFLAQREDVVEIRPEEEIDPRFAESLRQAKEAGVGIYGRKCKVSLEGVELGDPIPVYL